MSWSEAWKFFRENFDKMLLLGLFVFTVGVTLHISHDQKDNDQVLWAREMAGTVLGGLLGLITGHALAGQRSNITTTSGHPPQTTSTTQETS